MHSIYLWGVSYLSSGKTELVSDSSLPSLWSTLHRHSTCSANIYVMRASVSSVTQFSRVQLFATPWTVAHQASLSLSSSCSLLRLMSIEAVIPSNHLILFQSPPAPSSCLQSFPASGSFLMSQFFASGRQYKDEFKHSSSFKKHVHIPWPCPSNSLLYSWDVEKDL